MLVIYVFAAAFALAVCLAADRIGGLLGVMDSPDGVRKVHEKDTPLVGGVATVVPVVGLLVYAGASSGYAPLYLVLAAVAGGSLVLGYMDDRGHVRPSWRLLGLASLCVAALYAAPALRIDAFAFSFTSVPVFLHGWATLFTAVCLVGLQNAVNMADGENGLASGLALIWLMCLLAYAPDHLTPILAVSALCLLIAIPFNWTGRLFLGDAGAYALGGAVGAMAVYVYDVGFTALPADVVALWFLVPVADCLRLMATRALAGRSPFSSDRNHLHHVLNGLMPRGWALTVYFLLVAVPAALAYAFPEMTLLWIVFTVACYCVFLFVGAHDVARRRLRAL